MQLLELLNFESYTKSQLIELCNALYELLQNRPAQAPAFTFIPQQQLPYVAPLDHLYKHWSIPMGGTTNSAPAGDSASAKY